jgi:hypothetical protein
MLDQLARTLLIWITLAVLAHSAGPAVQQATVPCPTCDGAGQSEFRCQECRGASRLSCQFCSGRLPPDPRPTLKSVLRRLRADPAPASPKLAAEREQRIKDLEERLGKVELLFAFTPFAYELLVRPADTPDDEVRCPAGCDRGSVPGSKRDCAYCEGAGFVKCMPCNMTGSAPCGTCKGAGAYPRSCPDCMGAGQIHDPASRDFALAQSCPLCLDKFVADCRDCNASGSREAPCRTCHGEGQRHCGDCGGSSQRPCEACHGIGYSGQGFVNGCNDCRKRGKSKCSKCKNGKVKCPTCKGARTAKQDCLTCHGLRQRECAGCARGPHRGWEIAGQVLLKAGDRERAVQYFTRALQRADAYHGELLARAAPPDRSGPARTFHKSLQAARDADIERLKKRIAEATQSSDAPPAAGG